MSRFYPMRSPNLDARIRRIEEHLAAQPAPPAAGLAATLARGLAIASPGGGVSGGGSDGGAILNGDVVGPTFGTLLEALNGTPITWQSLSASQVLTYDGTEWLNRDWVTAPFGVGGSPTDGQFEVFTANLNLFLTNTTAPLSGARSLVFNKGAKTDTVPHSLDFAVGGTRFWGQGMDGSTNTTTGRSDWVTVYDYSANGGAGADVFRWSAEADSTQGVGCKAVMGHMVGTPHGNSEFLTLAPGTNMGGLRVVLNATAGNAYYSLIFSTGSVANNYVGLGFGDAVGANWKLAQDINAGNVRDLTLQDVKNSLARLFIASNANANAAVGFGSTNPQAVVSANSSAAAGAYNTVQRYFCGSYADNPPNRSINLEMILDASSVRNYLWLEGGLGAGSTQPTPVATSTFVPACGIEGTDTGLSIVVAPSGTNQALSRVIQVAYGGGAMQAGFFGVGPIAQPTGGAATAGATYTATEQGMLQRVYTAVRSLGLMT